MIHHFLIKLFRPQVFHKLSLLYCRGFAGLMLACMTISQHIKLLLERFKTLVVFGSGFRLPCQRTFHSVLVRIASH